MYSTVQHSKETVENYQPRNQLKKVFNHQPQAQDNLERNTHVCAHKYTHTHTHVCFQAIWRVDGRLSYPTINNLPSNCQFLWQHPLICNGICLNLEKCKSLVIGKSQEEKRNEDSRGDKNHGICSLPLDCISTTIIKKMSHRGKQPVFIRDFLETLHKG